MVAPIAFFCRLFKKDLNGLSIIPIKRFDDDLVDVASVCNANSDRLNRLCMRPQRQTPPNRQCSNAQFVSLTISR